MVPRSNPLAHLDPDAPLCSSGKRPFRTEAQARHSLVGARAVRSRDDVPARRPGVTEAKYYHCPACGWWHLSSTTGKVRRGRLAATKSTKRRR